MLILGIDPGSIKTGFGVIKLEGRHTTLVECGVLPFDSNLDLVDRLDSIHAAAAELIAKFQPDVIALESLIFAKSVPSMAKLAQARGAIIAAFGSGYRGKIFEYAPALVKSTVTGHGKATKEGVEKTLKTIFGKQLEFASHDASDAVAIALCHALHGQTKSAPKKASRARTLKNVFAKWEGR